MKEDYRNEIRNRLVILENGHLSAMKYRNRRDREATVEVVQLIRHLTSIVEQSYIDNPKLKEM